MNMIGALKKYWTFSESVNQNFIKTIFFKLQVHVFNKHYFPCQIWQATSQFTYDLCRLIYWDLSSQFQFFNSVKKFFFFEQVSEFTEKWMYK